MFKETKLSEKDKCDQQTLSQINERKRRPKLIKSNFLKEILQ